LFQNPIPQLLYGDFCNTIGTKRTCRPLRLKSAYRGKADMA
jgi:hypothetical protein